MLYNYLRFDSPFEFGLRYQLTSADQSKFGLSGGGLARVDMLNAILNDLFSPPQLTHGFPYVTFQGVFANFPILLITLYGAVNKNLCAALRRLRFLPLYRSILVCTFVILASQVFFVNGFNERYNSDVYWLLCLAAFLIFGCQSMSAAGDAEDGGAAAKLSSRICLGALFTLALACLYFFVPNDSNFASISQEFLSSVNRVLRLGKD